MHLGGTDVLGDAPGLSVHHGGTCVCTEAADVVQQAGLTVIDMT